MIYNKLIYHIIFVPIYIHEENCINYMKNAFSFTFFVKL